ncbi:hypothetical protein ACFYXS_25015 [Streptomyces sp. NPDC002574]|uniref:hypothetical protein n=1 Tax=Streptomyces sp. NPDC002574 TaxID=3364652 RepID=UPI0036BD91B5
MAETGEGRGRRFRVWVGLGALALGSFAVGDTVDRVRAAAGWAAAWWPWVLLALAAFNLLRSAVEVGSLIGPGLLVGAALIGLVAAHGIKDPALMNLALPGVLVLAGAVLLGPSRGSRADVWSRFLATGRVYAPAAIGARTQHRRLTVRAVAGEIRADFTGSTLDGSMAVHVTAIAGHVHLTVPRNWPVAVRSSGMVLTRVTDTGPTDRVEEERDGVGLHLLGVCGAVSLVRA